MIFVSVSSLILFIVGCGYTVVAWLGVGEAAEAVAMVTRPAADARMQVRKARAYN